MNTPSADVRGSNRSEMEEEEEDNENWALPASTLPDQAAHSAHYGPSLLVHHHPVISGNKEVPSDNGRVSSIELNTNKAGMEGLDKEKINKVIREASKGSRFLENQKKRELQTTERINKMMEKLARLTESEKQAALTQVDETVRDMELSRDLTKTIVHIDMDMFYAAVEMRDSPELREKPMAVGGMGMLSTSNYKARRFGVRAAMPGFIGKKLCPELILVPPHFDKYKAVSTQVRAILAEYDPNYCPMSLDEAYFDLTEYLERRRTMSAEERTYPYCSAEDLGEVEGKQNATSDEATSDKSGQLKEGGTSDEAGTSFPVSASDEKTKDEDRSLFTPVSINQGESTPDTVPSNPAKVHPMAQPDSSHRHGNTTDASNPEVSTSEAECCEHQEQDVKEEDGTRRTSRQDGKFETFGVTCEEVVREIRFRIEQKTMLTASAGIAPNCMLAKICSDKNKPNGQYRIQPTREDVMEFIRDLPIRKICGIGKVTEKMLSALGIQNCTDLYQQRALFYLLFSQISSSHFLHISLGLGSTHVERDGERKSISTERTFKEISAPSELYSKCMELCEALAEDLKKDQIQGKTVTVKLKTVNFEVKSRAFSLKVPVSSTQEIFAVARELLRTEIRACHPQLLRLRLMGVRLSSLQDASKLSKSRQGTLLAMFAKKQNTTPETPQSHITSTCTSGCTAPSVGIFGDNNPTRSATCSTSINTTEELSYTSRTDVLAPDTAELTLPAGVGASDDKLGSVLKEEGVISRTEEALEDGRSTPSAGVGVSVHRVDSTVSSDAHCSLHHTNQLEPRLPFSEDIYVSGTDDDEHSSIDGQHRDEHMLNTEQLYHPELLSKSEIFNQERNQRLDRIFQINSHATPAECTSSVEPEARQMMTCPICGQERAYSSVEDMNRHVDVCLNKSAIKEMLHNDKPRSSSSSNNRQRKSSPKKQHSRKRSHSGSVPSSSKKKRSKSTPCRTLHDFFQNKDKDT